MVFGVLLVLAACCIWGLIFVIPELLIAYSPLEVALGRYLCFGFVSFIFMMAQGWQKWRKIPFSLWKTAFIYALVVNIFYYFTLVLGLRYSNASVIALIQGINPITISFYGNWRQKECDFKQLIIPSCLIAAGLILVNIPAFSSETTDSLYRYCFGLFCGFLSLIAWNWYVVANAQFLKQNPHIQSGDWATLIGVSTLVWVGIIGLFIGAFLFIASNLEYLQKYADWNDELQNYLLGICVLGFLCSWLGSYLWNKATKTLPISFAGQLTIFETIFGLIFVYAFKETIPSSLELLGIFIILSGVLMSMQAFRKGASKQRSLQAAH